VTYVMESPGEGERLIAQDAANPSRERLRAAGLRAGMAAVDLGCGSGASLPAMAELVGPEGSVVGFEPNPERLALAGQQVATLSNVRLQAGTLPDTGLPSGSFDFVWSQFVFEYLGDVRKALAELVRIARPGATIAIVDIDGLGAHNWPEPGVVTHGLAALERALARTGFDLYVGRKLFNLFSEAGLEDVSVRVVENYVAAGRCTEVLLADWRQRLLALRPVALEEWPDEAGYDAFARAYLEMLESPSVLKYDMLVLTRGRKPWPNK